MTRPTPTEIEEAVEWARRVEEISEAHGQSCHEYEFAARALLAVVVERDEARKAVETNRKLTADERERLGVLVNAATRLRDQAVAERDELRKYAAAFVEQMHATEREANRGRGGQHVTFSGEFHPASMTPSIRSRLNWWARAFEDAMEGASDVDE